MKILIVGAGLAGCTCARVLADAGHDVILVEKKDHIGGICYDYLSDDKSCYIHKYGPHVFHTDNEEVYSFVTRFTTLNGYVHRIAAIFGTEKYPFPINLNTISKFFGKNVYTKEEADSLVSDVSIDDPKNFEEAALNAVGTRLYNAFIKEYTKKQWKVDPKELPVELFTRINIRYDFNDTYFKDRYQGQPIDGYTAMLKRMIDNPKIMLNLEADFNRFEDYDVMIYTGSFEGLPYRSIEFNHFKSTATNDGYPVVNFSDSIVKQSTRLTDFNFLHKAENSSDGEDSDMHNYCIEYPVSNNYLNELYPILTQENMILHKKKIIDFKLKHKNVFFCGRLATYRYLDMDDTIAEALKLAKEIMK